MKQGRFLCYIHTDCRIYLPSAADFGTSSMSCVMSSLSMSSYEMVIVARVRLVDCTIAYIVFFQKFIAIHVIKYASVVTEARQSPSWSLKYTITQPVFPRLVIILSRYCYLLLRSETNYLCWLYSHILLLISFFIILQFVSVKCESQLRLLSRPEHSSQIFIVKHLFVVTLNTDVSK